MAQQMNKGGGSARRIGKSGASARPRTDAELQEALGETRYPADVWPISTVEQRAFLLERIAADVEDKRISRQEAYGERLRFSYRCYLEGV